MEMKNYSPLTFKALLHVGNLIIRKESPEYQIKRLVARQNTGDISCLNFDVTFKLM